MEKRRVIYMSDEEWTDLKERAKPGTVSAYIRGMAASNRLVQDGTAAIVFRNHSAPQPIGRVTHLEADERGVTVVGERYDQRPVRAVPKRK